MKKFTLFFIALMCFSLTACGSNSESSNDSKQSKTTNTAVNSEKTDDTETTEQGEKKTLSVVGDSIEDPSVGKVTLESRKDLNQVLKVGNLSIYLTGLKVLTVTEMNEEYKNDLTNSLKQDLDKFTYAQITYTLKNNEADQINWSGFEYAVVDGVQKDLGYNRMLRYPNPENIEILGNSSQENSFVTVPVTTSTKKVRLKTADVILSDRSKDNRLTHGKEIEVSIK